jgi:cytochrome c peroxidase
VDALNWDLLNDGLGNPKNAKSMLLAHRTPPAMSGGVRETAEAAVRAGVRHILFSTLPEQDCQAIDAYLNALSPVPSPYLVDGELSEAALRGKQLFFSSRINCARCHDEPLYTDLRTHDVESQGKYDRRSEFDTPTLIEVWRTAPYLHDGHYTTIKRLIRDGKHGSTAGEVQSLTERELDDLAEFVLSL